MTSFRLWVYLQTTPLVWLTATLAAFLIAEALANAARRHPLANPVAIAIPCHRVVRQDGDLGGYRWGLDRKERLLELERRN